MAMIVHQTEGANFNFYQKRDLTVVDPKGNEVVITSSGKTSKEYSDEVQDVVAPWEKSALLVKKAKGEINTGIRDRGNLQWDTYDILFDPSEIEGREAEAMEAVKQWAGESKVPGKEGKRLFAIQDWHYDGNTPHIRVDVHRAPWPDENTVNPFVGVSNSERNDDLSALTAVLAEAGFVGSIQGASVQRQVTPNTTNQTSQTQQAPQTNQRTPFSLLNKAPAGYQEIFESLESKKAEQEKIRAQHERVSGEVDFLERAVSALQHVDELKQQNENNEIVINDLQLELSRATEANEKLNIVVNEAQQENERLEAALNESYNNAVNLKQIITDNEERIAGLEEDYSLLSSEIIDVSKQKDELQDVLNQTKQTLEQTQQENTILSKDKEQLQQQNGELQQAVEQSKEEVEAIKQELGQARNSIAQMAQENEAIKRELQLTKQAHEQEKEELLHKNATLQKAVDRAKEEAKEASEHFDSRFNSMKDSYDAVLESLRAQIAALTSTVTTLKETNTSLVNAQQQNTLKHANEDLLDNSSSMSKEISNMEKEINKDKGTDGNSPTIK